MGYGEPMTTTIPAVGAVGTQYATDINARLAEIETILESKVPYTALTGDELDLNNVPIRDATYVELYESASEPSGSPVGRLARYQNNLYWVTDESAVRITLNDTLDASSVAGIGGDYGGANPALVSFNDGTSMYEFYDDNTTSTWGYVRARGMDIADGATGTDYVRLRTVPMAASYSWIFPAALPASGNSVLMLGSTGAVNHNDGSNTVDNTLYMSNNVNIELSGTGKIVHGEQEFTVTANPYHPAGATVTTTGGNGMGFVTTTAGGVYCNIDGMRVGWSLKKVKVTTTKQGTNTTTVQILSGSFGNQVDFGSNTSTTAGNQTIEVTSTDTSSFVTGQGLQVLITTGDNNDVVYQIGVVFESVA